MIEVRRSLEVPYPADRMYALVDRIEDYPSFLPWCLATAVERGDDGQVSASMKVGKGVLRHEFATANVHDAQRLEISIRLLRGPFSSLQGNWKFVPAESGSRIDFVLEYEFASGMIGRMFAPLFSAAYGRMIDSFAEQAERLHSPAA